MDNLELEFLEHSNFIESEYSSVALDDAIKAWEYLKHKTISMENVLNAHKLLTERIRPDIAGKIRTCDVFIGGNRKIFISQSLIKENLLSLFDDIAFTEHRAGMSEVGDSQVAKNLHIQFEQIHPFEDGNGRVGRLIYNNHRLRLGLPVHIIHEGDEQLEYYKWFSNIKGVVNA